MPDRDARYWKAEFLKARDGLKCALKDETCKGELVIDHLNGNPDDNRPENLRFLCLSHNRREGRRSRESEREKNYEKGSSEMRVNIDTEPYYRRWLLGRLLKEEYITKEEAINAGAEKCQLSPTTTRKHLAKMISSLGPLKEVKDKERGKVIRLKSVGEMKEA